MEIVFFLTGGTIAMTGSAQGAIPLSASGQDLDISKFDDFLSQKLGEFGLKARTVLWADKPSPHISPEDMLRLAKDIDKELLKPELVGAVVSHGTDLLAETSFFLDLVLKSTKPVVCTGSMRHMEEAGYDGLRNILNSALLCKTMPQSSQVLIQMADKIYTARDSIKLDSVSVDPFIGQQLGSVGRISGESVKISQDISCTRPVLPFEVERIEKNVALISCYPGISSDDFKFWYEKPLSDRAETADDGVDIAEMPLPAFYKSAELGAKKSDFLKTGALKADSLKPSSLKEDFLKLSSELNLSPEDSHKLCEFLEKNEKIKKRENPLADQDRALPKAVVFEALGAGNIPPGLEPLIRKFLSLGIPMVLTTRCVQGGVVPLYAYKGGGRQLLDMGLISGSYLSALKAQLLLKIALGNNCSVKTIKKLFA